MENSFRGLRVDGKGWVYGHYIESEGEHFIFNGKEMNSTPIQLGGYSLGACYEVIPETVGKLLHLEKNGTEWYEGDIAVMIANKCVSGHPMYGDDEWIENEYTGLVCFHIRYGLCIKVTKLYDLLEGEEISFAKNLYKTISFYRTKIIGNIHEESAVSN